MLTERARRWAMWRGGQHHKTVAGVARQLGVGWHTVLRAVRDYGQPLLDDPARLDAVTALGVDEHVWSHAGPGRPTRFATGIVDLTSGRSPQLLDVVPGRTGKVYADWLAEREAAWRQRVRIAVLDPFRGYGKALSAGLLRVLDAFHVVKLGNDAVDQARRQVAQDTLGHRGHKGDPLYQVRRLLRRGAETLPDRQIRRLDLALAAGDRHEEVAVAWQCAHQLRAVYRAPNPAEGRRRARRVLDILPSCPIGELARLGRTLSLADRVPRLPRHRRRLERPDRGDQPADRTQPAGCPRLPELRQLPAATTPQLQRPQADSTNCADQNPQPTLHGVDSR